MEPDFDVERFEKKLLSLKDTQDSITGLSKWCLNKRLSHKQIVRSWLNVLKQGEFDQLDVVQTRLQSVLFLVKIESRLTLFYLANDVIQHSKRRNYEFVDSWGTTLQKATTLVREDKVKEKISRIFNIWEQREIYSEDFIADLHGLLAINSAKKTSTSITPTLRSVTPVATHHQPLRSDDAEDEFQLAVVVGNIRNCVALESETDKNLKVVVKTHVPDMEKTRSNLKGLCNLMHLNAADNNSMFYSGFFFRSITCRRGGEGPRNSNSQVRAFHLEPQRGDQSKENSPDNAGSSR